MKIRYLLSALSACLLVLSFPDFNLGLFAWVALIPLFFALDGEKPQAAFLIAYLAGAIFFLGTIYWLIHVTFPGMIVVVLYLGLYFGCFGAITAYILRTRSSVALLVVPALWVALEWVRAHLLTGFGWVLLGHSQAAHLTVIQIADITGAYGVSFLVALVNLAIFLTLKSMKAREYKVIYLMVALTLVFLVSAYGVMRLRSVFTGERLRVAVIQGNIPQTEKWDRKFREGILEKYNKLTREAAKERPGLVIWPETSVPAFLELEKDVSDRIRDLARTIRAPILVGAPSEDMKAQGTLYNSAVLFGEDGMYIGQYNKVHLVPFGEYVPFKRVLSFVERFAPSPIGDFSSGKDFTVLSFVMARRFDGGGTRWKLMKKVRFSCLICFEDIFPELARRFVRSGANFLVNITNDAWFKRSSAPYQHAESSVFRAVENRVSVVRAANTGYSCFIDQKGEITASVGAGGRHIFVDGFKVHDIILSRAKTLYNKYGDVFAYACICIALVYLFGAIIAIERTATSELIS